MTGDFHIHTRASDGSSTAERVMELSQKSGITHLSITDHDNLVVDGSCERLAQKYGLNLLNGVELSSMDYKRKRRVHILCYLPKRTNDLIALCKETVKRRAEAGIIMAEKVSKLFPVSVADIQNEAKYSNCIFKQHIMKTLMDAGYTEALYGNLFKELFSYDSGSCVVEYTQQDVFETAKIAKESGGIVVMAHPFTYNGIDVMHELIGEKLLDGIEVWSSKSDDRKEEYLLSVADENNLIKFGGSDFHGAFSSRPAPIGAKPTPQSSIEEIFNCASNIF